MAQTQRCDVKTTSPTPPAYTIAQLVEAPESMLGALDKQRRYISRTLMCDPPCPACGTRQSWFKAHRLDITTATYADIEKIGTDSPAKCLHCSKPIGHVLPFFGGGWLWVVHNGEEV